MADIQQRNETLSIPENAVLIDLRDEADYAAGHIPGAQRISAGSLREEIRRIARFNTPILLYCYNGKKSEQAAELLRSRGYTNARSIGGIEVYQGRLEPELTVRELREKKGLSQSALARMIGIRQPTVAAYESGKANPGPEICGLIRRYFFVTIRSPEKDRCGQETETVRSKRLKQTMSIRELRKACGLTQAEFARSIGVCTGSIAAYESGKTRPGTRVTDRIREVYRVDISGVAQEKPKKPGRTGREKHG